MAGLVLAAILLVGGLLVQVILGPSGEVALAQQPQQAYDLSWWTVDGGGGTSAGAGSYRLDGTTGQSDPGPVLRGEGYNLEGGFWGGGVSGVTMFNIYLPLLLRNY